LTVRPRRQFHIRRFMPARPYMQGKLDAEQSLFMAVRKPDVEFCDAQADPGRRQRVVEFYGDRGGERESAGASVI